MAYRTKQFVVERGVMDWRLAHGGDSFPGDASFSINQYGKVLSMSHSGDAPDGLFGVVIDHARALRKEYAQTTGRPVRYGRFSTGKRDLLSFYARRLNELLERRL